MLASEGSACWWVVPSASGGMGLGKIISPNMPSLVVDFNDWTATAEDLVEPCFNYLYAAWPELRFVNIEGLGVAMTCDSAC